MSLPRKPYSLNNSLKALPCFKLPSEYIFFLGIQIGHPDTWWLVFESTIKKSCVTTTEKSNLETGILCEWAAAYITCCTSRSIASWCCPSLVSSWCRKCHQGIGRVLKCINMKDLWFKLRKNRSWRSSTEFIIK